MFVKEIAGGTPDKPNAFHKPACYWFWQHVPTRAEISAGLNELQDLGFGSFQIAARLSTPREDYLAAPYLKACRDCADLAAKAGLMMGIYDDYNWQSGHAGGRVVAANDALRESQLFWSHAAVQNGAATLTLSHISSSDADCLFDVGKNWIYEGGRPLWDEWQVQGLALLTPEGQLLPLDSTAATIKSDAHSFRLTLTGLPAGEVYLFVSARCASSRMVNYLLKETARTFIQVTYEPYAEAFGPHLGTTVRYMFFDQPHACFYQWAENNAQVRSSLMYSPEFMQKLDALPGDQSRLHALVALFGDIEPDSPRYRCALFEAYAKLAFDHYFQPLRTWCQQHHIAFSGHEVLGHVRSWNLCDKVITEDNRCNFALDYFGLDRMRDLTAVDAKDNVPQLSAKFGDSVARSNGRSGCILEQYYGRDIANSHFGAGYWELKPCDLYAQVVRHHLLGMRQFLMHAFYLTDGDFSNDDIFINPHLDFAPGINYEPWAKPLFQRLCALSGTLSQFLEDGQPLFDMAIFYPRRDLLNRGMDTAHGAYTAALCQYLSTHGYDYLFVDEDDLPRAATQDGHLCLENESFPALLLPDVHSIKSAHTLELLLNLAKQGIKLLCVGQLPQLSLSFDDADKLKTLCLELQEHCVLLPANINELSAPYAPQLEQVLHPLKEMRLHLDFAPRNDAVFSRLIKTATGYKAAIFNDSSTPLYLHMVSPQRCTLRQLDLTCGQLTPDSATSDSFPLVIAPHELNCVVLNYLPAPEHRPLSGPWTLTLENGSSFTDVDVNHGWQHISKLTTYCGIGSYSCSFTLEQDFAEVQLDVPSLGGGMELILNGHSYGPSFGAGCHNLGAIKCGTYELILKVYSSAANYYYQHSRWRCAPLDDCGLTATPILRLRR